MGATKKATKPAAPATSDTATAADEQEQEQEGPKNGREYLAALGRAPQAFATFADLLGILEYFGAVPQPDHHASTPFSRTE